MELNWSCDNFDNAVKIIELNFIHRLILANDCCDFVERKHRQRQRVEERTL